jgi:hypothetical protein
MAEIFNRSLAVLAAGFISASLLVASFTPPAGGLITLI